MRIFRWGSALALLLVTGVARAEAPREAELGTVMLDADNGKLIGDLEVEGDLVGTFEYRIAKAQFADGRVSLSGALTARIDDAATILGNVRVVLTRPADVCKSLSAATGRLPLEALGLVVPARDFDVDFIARTAHGRTIGALLCAASQATDPADRQLLPQFAQVLASLASRSILLAAGGPAVATVNPSPVERIAPQPVVLQQPQAAPVTRSVTATSVVAEPQAPQPSVADAPAPAPAPRRARQPQQRHLPPPPDPTADNPEAIPSSY